MSFLKKMIIYAKEKKSWQYIARHPTRITMNIRGFIQPSSFVEFASRITGHSIEQVKSFMPREESQRLLEEAFRKSIAPETDFSPCNREQALALYLIVRIMQPEKIVETGVSAGRSTAYILCALKDNQKGELHSIDPLPNSGYAISERLKGRWHFYNDISANVLPNLLFQLGQIDIFLHDSLHSHDNMIFEYKTAWPYIRQKGLLLSDNVDWNSAFEEFGKTSGCFLCYLDKGFGAIHKH